DQGRRHAHGAFTHGLRDEFLHAFEFFGRWRTVGVAQHHLAHLRRPHVSAEVYARALLFETLEVLVEGAPVHGQVKMFLDIPKFINHCLVQRRDGSTLAGDFGGNALSEFADGLLVDEEVEFGLAEHVDEAGGHDQAARVNDTLRLHLIGGFADERDLVTDNPDIGVLPGIAAAIHNFAIADENVELLRVAEQRAKAKKDGGKPVELFHAFSWENQHR